MKYLLWVVMMATTVAVNASNHSTASDSEASSGSLAGASVDSHDRVNSISPATDLSRAVPSTVVPNPSVGFAVCDSAYTFGGSFAGVGAAIGVPVGDAQCNLREDAKTTKLLGEPTIAKEMMCTSVRFFKSSYRAHRPCFPDSEMLGELSEDEMEIYHSILAARDAAKQVELIKQQQPIRADELVRKRKINLSTKPHRK